MACFSEKRGGTCDEVFMVVSSYLPPDGPQIMILPNGSMLCEVHTSHKEPPCGPRTIPVDKFPVIPAEAWDEKKEY